MYLRAEHSFRVARRPPIRPTLIGDIPYDGAVAAAADGAEGF